MKIYSFREVALRAGLYMICAALSELVPLLALDIPINWPYTLAKVALAVFLTLRAYIDKSSGQTESDVLAMAPAIAPAVASAAGNAAQGAIEKAVNGASAKIGNQVENAVNDILGGDDDDESDEEVVAPSE